MKLKNSNEEKTKIVTQLKKKPEIATKLENSNYDKTQKLKL